MSSSIFEEWHRIGWEYLQAYQIALVDQPETGECKLFAFGVELGRIKENGEVFFIRIKEITWGRYTDDRLFSAILWFLCLPENQSKFRNSCWFHTTLKTALGESILEYLEVKEKNPHWVPIVVKDSRMVGFCDGFKEETKPVKWLSFKNGPLAYKYDLQKILRIERVIE